VVAVVLATASFFDHILTALEFLASKNKGNMNNMENKR
jgi:hypothetical protein